MKVVLKFTNRENDTVTEHSNIIDHHGYVWWGWWKKDTEPTRLNELQNLKNETKPIKIGLFEGSSDRYFEANLLDIDFIDSQRRVSSPEASNTPSYYNQKTVPAWFKFSSIVELSEDDFHRTYGDIPPDDFSFFNTTEASSTGINRVKVASEYLLHLSDIHFGDDHAFPKNFNHSKYSLLDQITNDLENQGIKPGIVAVTGDLTTRGDANYLFDTALPFLENLSNKLDIQKDQVIIIPGNHDIRLTDEVDITTYVHEATFKAFLDRFYECDKPIIGLDYFELPDKLKLDILRINSVKLRTKDDMNFGYVNWKTYRRILKDFDNKSDSLKIALIHHHLIPAPKVEEVDLKYPSGSISSTIDSGLVINELQSLGFQVALHGHQHLPNISKIARGFLNQNGSTDLEGLKKDLFIVAGGSAGVKKERWSSETPYNTYGIYRILKESVEVRVRKFNPTQPASEYFNSILELNQSR